MSTTITRDIQNRTHIDDNAARILRSLDLEWRCGVKLLQKVVHNCSSPEIIGDALTNSLHTYQVMCREGINDYERLKTVLGHIYQTLTKHSQTPATEDTQQWCAECRVPQEITEYLLNG